MNKKVKELFKSLSGSEICGILSILFFLLSYLYNYNKGVGIFSFHISINIKCYSWEIV